MNIVSIELAERWADFAEIKQREDIIKLKKMMDELEDNSSKLELLKTQIASARIDGKKEFDADTYMKGKKK